MEETKLIERKKEVFKFILKILKEKPLSPSEILKKIINERDSDGNLKFSINTLTGLRKDYLFYLEEQKKVFRLDKNDLINYSTKYQKSDYKFNKESIKDFLEDFNDSKISSKDFLEKFWFEWGYEECNKNLFHAYYFSTPKTAKWYEIFNRVIKKDIIESFGKLLKNKEEILKVLDDLIKSFQNIEMLPEDIHQSTEDFIDGWMKGLEEKNLIDENDKAEWESIKGKVKKGKHETEIKFTDDNLHGLDSLKHLFEVHEDFYPGVHLTHDKLMNDIIYSFYFEMNINLDRLHDLLISQEINVLAYLKVSLEQELKGGEINSVRK